MIKLKKTGKGFSIIATTKRDQEILRKMFLNVGSTFDIQSGNGDMLRDRRIDFIKRERNYSIRPVPIEEC